jgi:hypothetical protein
MTTEEIAKVAAIIGNLGEQAVDGLVVFLGFSLVESMVGYSIGAGVLYVMYKLLKPLVEGCHAAMGGNR